MLSDKTVWHACNYLSVLELGDKCLCWVHVREYDISAMFTKDSTMFLMCSHNKMYDIHVVTGTCVFMSDCTIFFAVFTSTSTISL